ncbi:MAG: hypothetical protein ABIS47_02990 [Acidimicrobiales bacterium]
MQRGRRVAFAVVGLAVMFLTSGLVLRLVGGSADDQLKSGTTSSSIDAVLDPAAGDPATGDVLPGDPFLPVDPTLPPAAVPTAGPDPVPTLPPPGVATIPLPDFSGGGGAASPTARAGPAFTAPGVWVVKADGTSPTLVARDATAGVAAASMWVAFVEGDRARAVRRSDLGTKVDLATGVTGTAAQGLPLAGGRRGVAFLQGGRAVLVDPATPSTPLASFAAPGADAVASEEDGEGRLVWADDGGLHVGVATSDAPATQVERGQLVKGHGVLAHLEAGRVVVEGGATLDWGAVDRLRTGSAGLVAASAGRIRFRASDGQERVLLDKATTPVLAGERILYVSATRTITSASLAGIGVTTVASAAAGRSITNIDLLDDTTLVVTVA